MLKSFLRWLLGGQRKADGKQHMFRQPGEAASDEEIKVSYEPGWWQTTGIWVARVAAWLAIGVSFIGAIVVGSDYSDSLKKANETKIRAEETANVAKADAEQRAALAKAEESKAIKAKIDVEAESARATSPCVDFIKIVKEDKEGTASVRCTHTSQVMTTTWEGGKFIVICKCPAKQ